MSVAWITVILAFAYIVINWRSTLSSTSASGFPPAFSFPEGLLASIVIASLVFGYNAAITALFVEPDFRYRQMVDLQPILISGLGLVSLRHWIGLAFSKDLKVRAQNQTSKIGSSISAIDIWQRITSMQLAAITIIIIFMAFAWWTLFMLRNTAI